MKLARTITGLALAAILGIAGENTARAATLNYNFSLGGNGLAQAFFDPSNINDSRVYLGGGTGTATYDTVAQTLQLSVNTTGILYGATSDGAGGQQLDRSNIVTSGVHGTATINYTNVTQNVTPSGLFGFALNNSTSSGTVQVDNLALTGYVGGANFNVMSMFMDFASDPGLVATHPEYTDIANIGSSNYFQYVSTNPLSSFFNQLVFFTWMNASNDVVVNGINYGHVHGDILGSSAVPEPTSVALLGCGLLAAAGRRKRKAA